MESVRENPSSRGTGQEEQEPATKDLNDLLNPGERRELIDFVTLTIDMMEQYLSSPPPMSRKTSPRQEPDSDATGPMPKTDEKDGVSVVGDDEKSPETRPKLQSRRSHTTSSRMASIKAEAELTRHFSVWRESVLLRIGEVLKGASGPNVKFEKVGDRSGGDRVQSLDRQTADSPAGQFVPPRTTLNRLPTHAKINIIDSLLLLLISLEHYNAHSRVLLVHVTSSLGLSGTELIRQETKVAKGLIRSVKELSGEKEAKAKAEQNETSRRWKVGFASVAGAALIGVTGGLAAPLVAAGIGAVMGTLGLGAVAGYLGAVAGSSVIVGGLFGAYGARMSGKVMQRYTQEVEDFAFIPIHNSRSPSSEKNKPPISSDHRLRVTIGISGWLTREEDIVDPWRVLGDDSDVFALRWELEALLRLGNALTKIVRYTAWTFAGKEILKRTVLGPLVAAVTLPLGLQRVSRLVDNPFRVAKNRADKAGEILADALINKAQGERPVTLIGYSLGARVIFSCLSSLAKRRAFGLVESAVLIGAPTPSATNQWRMMRTVVSGRLVNVFSENDSILRFLYRTNSMQFAIAGLEAVKDIRGVENYDVSDTVSGHLRYQYMIGGILKMIGIENLNGEQLQAQAEILHAKDEAEERMQAEREEQMKLGNPDQLTADEQEIPADLDKEVSWLEREIDHDTEEGLMHAKMGGIQMEDAEGDDSEKDQRKQR